MMMFLLGGDNPRQLRNAAFNSNDRGVTAMARNKRGTWADTEH
jgi:hypothetical protein